MKLTAPTAQTILAIQKALVSGADCGPLLPGAEIQICTLGRAGNAALFRYSERESQEVAHLISVPLKKPCTSLELSSPSLPLILAKHSLPTPQSPSVVTQFFIQACAVFQGIATERFYEPKNDVASLVLALLKREEPTGTVTVGQSANEPGDLAERLSAAEKREIVAALEKSKGNIASASRMLGINRSTLYYRLRKHGLEHLLPVKLPAVDDCH